jgi:hypothetical protein
MMNQQTKLDQVVWLLAGLLVFFTATLFLAEWLFGTDGQFYQTVAGLATGVSGALLMRITGHSGAPSQSSDLGQRRDGDGAPGDGPAPVATTAPTTTVPTKP